MLDIFINKKKYTLPKTYTIFQACQHANIDIPRFCYHDKLSIAGNCRMCLVEIEKSPKPVASCATPLMPNMHIFTDSPLVKKARESVLEFLLINHPLDCPICDQGGECDLQDQTLQYGSDRGRFSGTKRSVENKNLGPIIKTIMTRCIHCTRCLRFASEVGGIEILGATGRGQKTEIGTYIQNFIKSELSGNLVDLCPVGALTSKPYAFIARNWELKKYESFDCCDAIGSNIVVYTKNNTTNKKNISLKDTIKDEILRILPKTNDDLNEDWISDKTRYFFDALKQNRNYNLNFNTKVKIKADWVNSIDYFNFLINNVEIKKIIALMDSILDIKDIFFFKQLLNEFGINNLQYSSKVYNINMDLPYFFEFNSMIKNIDCADAILLIGVNPKIEAAVLNARIRKNYVKKNLIIAKIGSKINLNYPTLNLGISSSILQKIAEGKHTFCQTLRNTKKFLIIQGVSLFQRSDAFCLTNIIRFINKKANIDILNNYNFSILHNNISLINLCALGVQSGIRSNVYLTQIKKTYNLGICINMFSKNMLKINTKSIINFSTHKTLLSETSILNLPIKTIQEKNSNIINTEGKSFILNKIISPSLNVKSVENICKISMTFLQKNLENFTFNSLIKELPILSNNKNFTKKFIFKHNDIKEAQNFFINSPLIINLKNFYKTDLITKNSTTLSECSLILLSKKTNFL